MRVHELDEKYGVSKETVKAALELADLPSHRLSTIDGDELVQFEAALETLQEDANEEPLPEFSDEEQEAPATDGEPREAIETVEPDENGFLEGEIVQVVGFSESGVPIVEKNLKLKDEQPDEGEEEEVMTKLELVDMDGRKTGEFEVDPKIGKAVEGWLKGRKVASASKLPNGNVSVVSYPDMQKQKFR